jgi:hypothetical protein
VKPVTSSEATALAFTILIGAVVYGGALRFFSTLVLLALNFFLRLEVPTLPAVLVATFLVAVAVASLIRTITYERRVYVASAISLLTLVGMQFERDYSILGDFFGYFGSAAYLFALPFIAARLRESPPNKSLERTREG